MKKLIAIAASVAALALVGPAAAQSPIIIKFSHVVAPNTPKGQGAEKFKELARNTPTQPDVALRTRTQGSVY